MIKSTNSIVYKTTFEDGTTHYGRVNSDKRYSPKTYISNLLSAYKHNINNPLRINMITDFEKKIHSEQLTLKCEIVFSGTTIESMAAKDSFIKYDKNSMNSRVSSDNTGKIAVEIIKIPKAHSKQLASASGDVVYYIDRSWAKRNGLEHMVNLFKVHPINSEFVLSLKHIERV